MDKFGWWQDMKSDQLDAEFERWLQRQPDHASSSYHVQIKMWASEVEMVQLIAVDLPGWVVIDWRPRGHGLSSKRALPAVQRPVVARLLDAIEANILHAQFQVILAPAEDWASAYGQVSLAPDLLPVLDAGHAVVLNVSAERDHGNWRVMRAHQPPSDEPIADFAA